MFFTSFLNKLVFDVCNAFKNIKKKKAVCKVAKPWDTSFPGSENKPTFDKGRPQHNVLYNCIVPDKLPDKKITDRCPATVNLPERNVLPFMFSVEKRSCKLKKRGFLSFIGIHGADADISDKAEEEYNSIGEVFDFPKGCEHCKSTSQGYKMCCKWRLAKTSPKLIMMILS